MQRQIYLHYAECSRIWIKSALAPQRSAVRPAKRREISRTRHAVSLQNAESPTPNRRGGPMCPPKKNRELRTISSTASGPPPLPQRGGIINKKLSLFARGSTAKPGGRLNAHMNHLLHRKRSPSSSPKRRNIKIPINKLSFFHKGGRICKPRTTKGRHTGLPLQ